jgi:EAL domain-containing protein (putative c-di-GMP-specific phosphodiesterase class I)
MPDPRTRLAEIMGGGHLVILYQPIVEATTAAPRAAEVLARWSDANGELRGADWLFARIAGDRELLRELDRQVLTQLVEDRAETPELLRTTLAINRDAAGLSPEDVSAIVDATAAQREAPLALELWEHLSEEQLAALPDMTAELNEAGIELWHDDFGSGERSLAHLSSIRSSVVKFDYPVAAQGLEDPHLRQHVGALTEMLHGLRRIVVAEGVESQSQAQWLEHAGVDWFQGWHYARPMPARHYAAWTEDHPARAA